MVGGSQRSEASCIKVEAPSTRVFSRVTRYPRDFQIHKGNERDIDLWLGEDVDLGLLHQILEGHQVWVVEEGDLGINGFVLMEERGT